MREKTRKIFIMIVMAALIVSLMAASFAALTYGRYTGGKLDEDSPYDEIIDFVGATAFEVTSPDAFINAINNGYSYIKIADDAEEPFVINNDIADVYTNLVLDVNGTTVIRNSRNPVLDVRRSISVVLVYDSSVEGSGGFYNPVGSALQTSGGSLTVGSGSYESGPKVKGSSSFSSDTSVTLYTRTSRTAGSYETKVEDTSMPSLSGDVYYTGDTTQYTYIENDTYLLYTEVKNAFVGKGETSDDATFESGQLYVNCKEFTTDGTQTTYSADIFAPDSNVASCDFYYYYPVDADGSPIDTEGTQDTPQTYAVIYGYNDVKALARDEKKTDENGIEYGMASALTGSGLVWPYAAIRSVEDGEVGGVTHARGGTFTTNFGTDNTYGIYSVGGTMTVGLSGESDPPKFQAIGKGVCINMAGTSGNADQTLTIENGEFSSKIGDTIKMSGGEMEVKKGSFTKDATGADENSTNNGSAISISGGTLTSSDTEDTSKPIQFHISGSYVNGIYAKGGEINIANAAFDFAEGENNQGVYNDGGTSRARWCEFSIPGDNNYGIHSTNGTTRASDCAITMTGEYAVGVYTTGGRALVEGGSINVGFAGGKSDKLLTSAAVSTEGGEIYLAGELTINSASLGVTVRKVEETEGSLEIADQEIKIENTTYKVAKGNVSINTPNATAIYINNGSLTNKGTVTVTSSVGYQNGRDKGWSWVDENGNAIPNFNKYNGAYVQGGSLVSDGTLNVTFTGVENEARNVSGNDQIVYNGENTSFLNQQTKSYAVRVEAGTGTNTNVTIDSGNITNTVGGGVLVNGGKVTLGTTGEGAYNESTKRGLTVQTTGTEVNTSLIYINGMADNWAYYWNMKGGDAVKVDGGDLYVYGGKYTAAQGNGILTRGGTANIFNGIFTGGYNSNYHATTGAASTYSFKAYGGTVKISGGDFNSEAEGAFVMGTSDDDKVTITGGSFQADGPTAFATWNGATVEFDDTNSENKITVSGESTGLTVEQVSSGWRSQNITIKSATFKSTNQNQSNKNGIWYGNGNAKLTISGGSFTGTTGSGLSIGETPNYDWNTRTHNIQLSGGSFKGGWNAPISNYSSNYLVSGAWTSGNNTSGQTFYIYS